MNSYHPGDPSPSGISERLCRLMAGLDIGISGAVLCVSWLGFHSWLRGDFWWAKFNVAGALFFGGSVYSTGFGRATLSGMAILIALYASVGIAFGLLARTRGFARNLLLGLLAALLWHVCADRFVWRRFDPFALAYFPSLATLPAHLLLAINFSRFAARYRALALTFGSPDWSRQFAEAPEAAPTDPSFATLPESLTESGPTGLSDEPAGHNSPESADPASPAPPTLATLLLLGPASDSTSAGVASPASGEGPPIPAAEVHPPSESAGPVPQEAPQESHLQKGSTPPIVD
jgi:hypothetical protein